MDKFRPGLYFRYSSYSNRVLVDLRPQQWRRTAVMEEKHSGLPGGTCMVRVAFEDCMEHTFINDLDSSMCCYFAGLGPD